MRSGVPARLTPPVMWMPHDCPDAASISRYSLIVYSCSFATFGSPFSVCMPPAACQVEPDVSSSRSTSTTSVQPALREVIENARADDTAADHCDLCVRPSQSTCSRNARVRSFCGFAEERRRRAVLDDDAVIGEVDVVGDLAREAPSRA